MMTILLVYAVSALAVALYTTTRTLSGIGVGMGRSERVVLLLVALAAGVGWVLFVPVYLVGWLRSPKAAHAAARLSGSAARLRAKVFSGLRQRLAH